MSIATFKNIGALIKLLRASANVAVTAGGAGDAVEVVGVTIDRAALGMPLSCVFNIAFKAVLAATKTLSITWTIYHSAASDMSGEVALATGAAAVVATGAGGGSTETGQLEIDQALDGAKQYMRLKFTPDLNAANTDTAELAAQVAVGGTTTVPV